MKSQNENQGQGRDRGGTVPQIRYLKEMKNVLYDGEWAKKSPNLELYYIWRGLKQKNGIRYDITIIPPRMLGKEFVKTKGHYHIGSYGELYKVLTGEGIFLIQDKEVKNIYFFRAKRGEFVLIPSNFGHTTINPSSKTLKMANWTSKKCKSDYKSIEKKKGFCYYYTICGWIKNKNYKKTPKLKEKKPLKSFPKNLNFLYGD
jgi:glucose-6-phosphate isomerase